MKVLTPFRETRRAFALALQFALLLSQAFCVQATYAAVQPLGSAETKKGGDFVLQRSEEPFSLNPIVADGHSSVDIQFHVMEPLLISDLETYEWMPALANRWKIHDDRQTYDFWIREDAVWSDGKPVTAADVKFSFDVLYNDKFPTAHMRPYYDGIRAVEVISAKQVRFHAKNTYFGNFISSAGIPVVPKHVYGDEKVGPTIHKTIVGSGPYTLQSWSPASRIVLKKNPRWWGKNDPLYKNAYNPERVIFRFVGNETMAIEMLKKGDLDFMALNADSYAKKTSGWPWGHSVFKVKAMNNYPKGGQFIAWNLDRPIFQDKRVRVALAMLMDRKLMIDRFNHGLSLPATGPWYQQSIFADPRVKPIEYDPAGALKLLREAGWKDEDGDGVLEKVLNGEKTPLRFTIVTGSKGAERYLTMFQNDAKQAGVAVELKYVDWSVLGSVIDRRAFDAVQADSGAALVDFDPRAHWHSAGIGPGGNNFSGYRNPKVDHLIDVARNTPDRQKRIPYMQEIFRTIAEDAPCLFLFNEVYDFYAFSKKMGRPQDTFSYEIGTKYWWVKP